MQGGQNGLNLAMSTAKRAEGQEVPLAGTWTFSQCPVRNNTPLFHFPPRVASADTGVPVPM
jgi:hypothetical protein